MTRKIISTLVLLIGLTFNSAHAADPGFTSVKLPVMNKPGQSLSVSDFKGKVVWLDFWASWCAPCRKSIPEYNRLFNKYKGQGLIVIGANTDDKLEKAERFLSTLTDKEGNPLSIDFVLLRDEKKQLANMMDLPTMPTAFLIDRKGQIKLTHAGFEPGDEAKIEEEIAKALKE